MASFRKEGSIWYYRFIDAGGKQRERRGCPDRRETERMAAAAETDALNARRGLVDPKAKAYRDAEARPIGDHLDAFEAGLIAKGGSRKHPPVTRARVARVLALARVERVGEMAPSKVREALGALRNEGLSVESINHHVRAVKAFSRWLWRDDRAREHRLAHLATTSPEADRRRVRRALTPEEATRLVRAAETGQERMGMAGPDRARCYEVALGTGFRASELASLTPGRLALASDPPAATVAGCYTKNGREAVQPIAPAPAARLAPWVATLAPDRPLFAIPRRSAEMIRIDQAAAGIPYETPVGVCDFHSLRAAFISNLVASGASVKTCHVLARHSTPSLTIGIYAMASLGDLGGAVRALPDLAGPGPPLSAETLALALPLAGDGSGRVGAELGGEDGRGPGGVFAAEVGTPAGFGVPRRGGWRKRLRSESNRR